MSYVVESGGSPRGRSRRKRAAVTLLVVAIMLFFAFWYAYSYYRGEGSGPEAGANTPTCTSTPISRALPKDTIVNVYNATTRSGLAATTATEVGKRGYVVDRVANDPLAKKVAGTAEVRYGTKGVQQAKLVTTLVTGSKVVRDKRTDTSVDLVLGAKFTTLAESPSKTAGTC